MILMPYHIDVVVLLAMRVMDTDVNPEVIYLISFLSLSKVGYWELTESLCASKMKIAFF